MWAVSSATFLNLLNKQYMATLAVPFLSQGSDQYYMSAHISRFSPTLLHNRTRHLIRLQRTENKINVPIYFYFIFGDQFSCLSLLKQIVLTAMSCVLESIQHIYHKLNALLPNGRSVPYALRLCNKLPIPRAKLIASTIP